MWLLGYNYLLKDIIYPTVLKTLLAGHTVCPTKIQKTMKNID
jgi:hypothetical protein